MTDTTAAAAAPARSWRESPVFLLVTLTLVSTINWADRQVVPILFPAIKADLGLSDTELGIIGGLAFSVVYALSSFVFGFLADRGSRRGVITFGLVAWSVATAWGGFATGFWSLFAARFFTGIGEASLYPCAMSLVADTFAPEKRGRAIGIVGASTAVGGGLGIGLGGRLAEVLGWREVFFLYGGAGFVVLPLLLALKEPARPPMPEGEAHESPVRIVKDALGDLRLLSIWGTGSLMMAAALGWVAWSPAYFVRERGFEVGEAGLLFGLAQLVGGVVGSLAGGRLGDAFRQRRLAGQMEVSALAALVSVPLVALALFDLPRALLVLCATLSPLTIFAYFPNLQTMIAELVPPRRLGLTFAVHVLFLSGIGAAVGPFLVGWASDATGSLRTGLFVPVFGILLSAIGAWVAAKVIRVRTPGQAAARESD